MKVREYYNILHKQVDITLIDGGVEHTLINGGSLQFIGHVIGNISNNLRLSFLDLPIIGGYFLYDYDINYFYLMKYMYGTDTEKMVRTKYRIKRPIKDTSPNEYETLLLDENNLTVEDIQYSIIKPEQTNLFGGS